MAPTQYSPLYWHPESCTSCIAWHLPTRHRTLETLRNFLARSTRKNLFVAIPAIPTSSFYHQLRPLQHSDATWFIHQEVEILHIRHISGSPFKRRITSIATTSNKSLRILKLVLPFSLLPTLLRLWIVGLPPRTCLRHRNKHQHKTILRHQPHNERPPRNSLTPLLPPRPTQINCHSAHLLCELFVGLCRME